MANYFKRYERAGFLVLLAATIATGSLGAWGALVDWTLAPKLLVTAGLLATASGVVQLEISGLFTKIYEEYGNSDKYPYGPPSYITREIIDNPDAPVRSWLRHHAFFSSATGFWLIITGTLVQVLALWI